MVEKIFIAHYTPLTHRKKKLVEDMEHAGLQGEWVECEPAADEVEATYDSTAQSWAKKNEIVAYPTPVAPKILNKAEISLAYKHIKIYEKIIEDNINSALILEDDVIFDDDFINKFNFNIMNTPRDWDFIFIGSGCDLRIDQSIRRDGIVAYRKEHPASKCTDSYVMNLESAKRLQQTIVPFSFPIDFELNYQMALHNMNVYWWEPPVVRQGSQCGLYRSQVQWESGGRSR